MKSDGPTGVPGPTPGGNSTSSTVLFGSKVRERNAALSECWLYYIYDTGMNVDFIHNLQFIFDLLHSYHGLNQKKS